MQNFCMVKREPSALNPRLRVRVLGAGPRVGTVNYMTVSYPVYGLGPLDGGDLNAGDLNGNPEWGP
jgi:hypothetical protein